VRKILMLIIMISVLVSSSVCFGYGEIKRIKYEFNDDMIKSVDVSPVYTIFDENNDNRDLLLAMNGYDLKNQKITKEMVLQEFKDKGVLLYIYCLPIHQDVTILKNVSQFGPDNPLNAIFEKNAPLTPDLQDALINTFPKIRPGAIATKVDIETFDRSRFVAIDAVQNTMALKVYITKKAENILTIVFQAPRTEKYFKDTIFSFMVAAEFI